MTGSGREGIILDWLKGVQPTSARSYNHNTSDDTARAGTSSRSRAIRGLINWRRSQTPPVEQPDSERRRRYARRLFRIEYSKLMRVAVLS
jgi:hypothetical protein